MTLTGKQERFVEEYLIDLNATQAATRAGYSKKTARSQGQRMLTNIYIQEALQKARQRLSEKAEISILNVLEELAKIHVEVLQLGGWPRHHRNGPYPRCQSAVQGERNVRDRVLSDDEIRWFWAACERVSAPWESFGKLSLLTGQRRSEVADMTDGDIGDGTWHLSADRTKNKRAHDVPLSDAALAVLAGVERIKSDARYIHTTTGKRRSAALAKPEIILPITWKTLPPGSGVNLSKFHIGRFTTFDAQPQPAWLGSVFPCA